METKPPDGGWGWMVVLSSLVCSMLSNGIGLSSGVLIPKVAEYFDESKSKVALIGSVLIGTCMCTGPLASAMVNKMGCRVVCMSGSILATVGFVSASFSPNVDVLIVTYGVVGGLGFGMVYLPAIVSVGEYFVEKRPLATGIAVCGAGLGTFIFSPMTEYLSETYDVRSLLIIIAGIVLNGVVCGMLFRPLNRKTNQSGNSNVNSQCNTKTTEKFVNQDEEKPFIECNENEFEGQLDRHEMSQYNHQQNKPETNVERQSKPLLCQEQSASVRLRGYLRRVNDIFDLSWFCNTAFVLIFIGNVFGAAAFFIPYVYFVDHVLLVGLGSRKAAWAMSSIGITNTIGRILVGALATSKKVNALLLNNLALFVASLALFLLPILPNYSLILIFCIVYGLCVATYVSLTSIIVCDVLGVNRLANAFGFICVARGVSTVVGPLVAGIIYQGTGSYKVSFYFGGTMFLIAAILHSCVMFPGIKKSSYLL